MKAMFVLIVTLCAFVGSEVSALPITQEQGVFAEQLREGRYIFPVIESGHLVGQPALFVDQGTAYATNDGFFRALLKGGAVVAGGVAGGALGTLLLPGAGTTAGAAVGAAGTKAVVDEINREGPGPGKKWWVADARLYDSVQVAGVGDILPGVLTTALDNIESTVALSSTLSVSFIDPNVIGVRVKNSEGQSINTIDLVQAFILTSTIESITQNFFGSVVLNSIGFPNSRPLTDTDFIDIDVGQLLSVADGTSVTMRSTPIVGFTVPEPSTIALLAIGTISLFGYSWRRKQLGSYHH